MASPVSTLSLCYSSSARNCKSTMYSIPSCSTSSSTSLYLKTLKFPPFSSFSQMGLCHFTPWNGLKHMGISISLRPRKVGNRGKCKGKVVYASLFGVGAPEALVIGVVALLVFGPKGLSELVRNFGKTLRTFQPTIRELQEVSKEFKSALEREISLDDDPSSVNTTNGSTNANLTPTQSFSSFDESQNSLVTGPNDTPGLTMVDQDIGSSPSENQSEADSQPEDVATLSSAYSTEEYLKITEEQLKAFANSNTQQNASSFPSDDQIEIQNQPQDTIEEVATATPPAQRTESEK